MSRTTLQGVFRVVHLIETSVQVAGGIVTCAESAIVDTSRRSHREFSCLNVQARAHESVGFSPVVDAGNFLF